MATEQQVESSLKELNELKAALEEHANVAITGPQGKITCVNDKSCSISRSSRAELPGQEHCLITVEDLTDRKQALRISQLNGHPLDHRHIDMTPMVREVIAGLNQNNNCSLETRVGDLRACEGDPALVKQVWINLIFNAVKCSRPRSPALVEAGCDQGNGACVYYVRDNGVGFDMKFAHKLFGVFQRLHRAHEFEGTGAGPAMVQGVVSRHGGCFWLNAESAGGATVYFTLEETESYDRQRN